MPIQLTDDLFEHLTPPDTVDWTLTGVRYPKDNPEPIVLELKWAGQESPFFKEMRKLALKPLPDAMDNAERALRQFAKLAIGGWRNVLDGGTPAPFDAKICGEFLARTLRKRGPQGIVEAEAMMGYAASPGVFRRAAPPTADDLGKE
jgi:hypothetical protein